MKTYKATLLFILIVICVQCTFGQQIKQQNAGIGLVLSGGGAKGLAHIGILKAIDSAGLKINYITGTSMGSIVGALYAVGYTADDIEKIARGIDWDLLLSNQSQMRSYMMEEKSEYNRYALEIPMKKGRIKLSSGLLEGEELWLKLSELFYPAYDVRNFNNLPIPFRCIATDLSTGKAVILDSGNLITALRSSMAIPSVFTAVDRNSKKLVDGGLIRNYPASDAKNMGATFIIGSDVASTLRQADKLTSPIDVLLQIAFFKEAELKPSEDSLCNINIKHDLEKYTTASFNSSEALIDSGIAVGRRFYPYFKHIADSLTSLYGADTTTKNQLLLNRENIILDTIIITGLKYTDELFFKKMMGIENNTTCSEEYLSKKIRNAFGTRYYNKIIYQLKPVQSNHVELLLDVTENPMTYAKIGLNYNRTTGVSAILNITTRNWIFSRSRDIVSANLGDNLKFKFEHMQLIGKGSGKYALFFDGYAERQSITTYLDYQPENLYDQRYSFTGFRFQSSRNRSLSIGAGTRFEWASFKPKLPGNETLDGDNSNYYSYLYFDYNTLNKPYLPTKGIKINTEAGFVYKQDAEGFYKNANGTRTYLNGNGLEFGNYSKFVFSFEGYRTVKDKNTFFQLLQSGILFNNTQTVFNDFFVGGLNKVIHNQALFAGVAEGTVVTPSYISYLWGWRKMWTTNGYTVARANIMAYDFLKQKNRFETPSWLMGYSITAGYNSPIGPLEFSFMYSHQTNKLTTYINLGFPF